MKKRILIDITIFLIGGLIFCSIGTVLALTYKASDIVYTPSDTSWNVTTVGEAINSLALSKTSDNYSTEEQVVGTWIDGKPVYQKTWTNISILLSNNWSSEFDTSNCLIDYIVNANALVVDGNYKEYASPAVRIMSNGNTKYYWEELSGNIINLTLQYTKTTDSAAN